MKFMLAVAFLALSCAACQAAVNSTGHPVVFEQTGMRVKSGDLLEIIEFELPNPTLCADFNTSKTQPWYKECVLAVQDIVDLVDQHATFGKPPLPTTTTTTNSHRQKRQAIFVGFFELLKIKQVSAVTDALMRESFAHRFASTRSLLLEDYSALRSFIQAFTFNRRFDSASFRQFAKKLDRIPASPMEYWRPVDLYRHDHRLFIVAEGPEFVKDLVIVKANPFTIFDEHYCQYQYNGDTYFAVNTSSHCVRRFNSLSVPKSDTDLPYESALRVDCLNPNSTAEQHFSGPVCDKMEIPQVQVKSIGTKEYFYCPGHTMEINGIDYPCSSKVIVFSKKTNTTVIVGGHRFHLGSETLVAESVADQVHDVVAYAVLGNPTEDSTNNHILMSAGAIGRALASTWRKITNVFSFFWYVKWIVGGLIIFVAVLVVLVYCRCIFSCCGAISNISYLRGGNDESTAKKQSVFAYFENLNKKV